MNEMLQLIFHRVEEGVDDRLATFLNGLRPQTLEYFETISLIDIGPQSFLAFSSHHKSLKELNLSSLANEAVLALPMLKGCSSIETLTLEDRFGTVDLEATHNEVFLEVIAWLRTCSNLMDLTIRDFVNGPAIVTPLLLENNTHLQSLDVEGYSMRDNRDFHQALGQQTSLESVILKGDGEDVFRDDLDALVDSLSRLSNLRTLRLLELCDYFKDEHICKLAQHLSCLEELWTGGLEITDAIWRDVGRLRNLRNLTFSAMTSFTMDSLLDFISYLGPGNTGFVLSVESASPESKLTEDEMAIISETISAKVKGEFIYVLYRGRRALQMSILSLVSTAKIAHRS
ncbi:MAG: hypothetical protein M1819_006465 [Sarea resinae]|nr:MAG: hypothetical protein M1819_006465 [Sarea resinae]